MVIQRPFVRFLGEMNGVGIYDFHIDVDINYVCNLKLHEFSEFERKKEAEARARSHIDGSMRDATKLMVVSSNR